jgi:hypothetical protein
MRVEGPLGGVRGAPTKEVRRMDVRLRDRRRARDTTTPTTDEPAVLPNWCPECGGPGYLDSINLTRETKIQSCQECGLRWESRIE